MALLLGGSTIEAVDMISLNCSGVFWSLWLFSFFNLRVCAHVVVILCIVHKKLGKNLLVCVIITKYPQ